MTMGFRSAISSKSNTIRMRRLLVIVLVFLQVLGSSVLAEDEESSSADTGYLYDNRPAIIDYHPVTDHAKDDEPDFLYSKAMGPRVVEFYAPWCPHCRHARDMMVAVAEQLAELTKDLDQPVKFYGISCTENKMLCRKFHIGGYPTIKLFAAGDVVNATDSMKYWEVHAFEVLQRLGVHVDKLALEDPSVMDKEVVASKETRVTTFRRRSRVDIYNDAHLSFDFALRNAVFLTNDPLSNSTKTALHDWLKLLKRTLPPTWNVQKVVHDLLTDFDEKVATEEAFVAVLDRYPMSISQWSKGCSYTCGLWELFHIVTVGAVEWNLMIVDGDWELYQGVAAAAETLRNYIENFFACDVCRVNFLHAYDACRFDRCHRLHDSAETREQWMELPLWLFETHNSVNVRLMKEAAEREHRSPTHQDEIDKHWPPLEYCPSCWREDQAWDTENVYKYLRLIYWYVL